MERPGFQVTVAAMLGVVACVALNLWLFRIGILIGIIGLNISKHLLIAYLCQVLGVGRRRPRGGPGPIPSRPEGLAITGGPVTSSS
jgi:hypothetical protein